MFLSGCAITDQAGGWSIHRASRCARGTKAGIDRLKDNSVVAFVDMDGIAEGDYGLPVQVEPQPGVGLDQLRSTIVSIHVQ